MSEWNGHLRHVLLDPQERALLVEALTRYEMQAAPSTLTVEQDMIRQLVAKLI